MKKRNRILAILLTAIMTFSMLPSEAFATEAIDTGDTAAAAVEEAITSVGEEQDVETTVEEISTVEEAAEEIADPAEAEEVVPEETVTEEAVTEEAAEPAADQEDEDASEEAADPAEAEEIAEPAVETVVETAETVEWPITLESRGGDYNVTATFDESAGFPADVKLNVSEISKGSDAYQSYYDQALEAVQNETDKEVKLTDARFFDITFSTEAGEVEPTGPVNVSIKYRKAIEAESSDDVHVLHFDDNDNAAPQVMDIETDGRGDKVDEVSFATEGFSVYAVIGTGEGGSENDNARAEVNFYNSDGTALIATMYVKNSDNDLETIIYDPGAGTLEDGFSFFGWSVDDLKKSSGEYYSDTEEYVGADYTDTTAGKTIAEVRQYISGLTFHEGDILNIYAMTFVYYVVDYLDVNGVSVGSDKKLLKTKDPVLYTVNRSYSTDDTHDFQGWIVVKGGDHIDGYPDNAKTTTIGERTVYYYENEDEIMISGDVTFSANAPEGHWLVFDENGKGATYNAPRFIKSGEVTSAVGLHEMERVGYTFDGWYTGAPSQTGGDPTGDPFTFGQPITATTTIYAKWKSNTEANYTVLIWRQNVAGNGYDFEKSVVIEKATVGSTPNAVTTSGSGDSAVAIVAGTTYSWTGFHFDHTDQASQTVNPEGNTVVNVYYNRNEITLNFYTWRSSWMSGSWQNYETMTGLYGSTLANNNFTWPTDYDWYSTGYNNGTTGGTRTTFMDAFLPPSNGTTMNFYGRSTQSGRNIYFLKQKADKTGYEITNTVNVASSTTGFNLSDKYNGFKCVAWNNENDTSNWHTVGEPVLQDDGKTYYYDADPSTPDVYDTAVVTSDGLYVYFDRLTYSLNFMDGAYVNGDNVTVDKGTVQLHEVDNITYGGDLASYNKDGATYYEPTAPAGYIFESWCIDDACTTPYTFTTMPEGGLTVYAKWRQIQYRVFLHPNAGTDVTLDWGSDTQEMNFRVAYDGKVSTPEGTRTGYDFLGWYFDEGVSVIYPKSFKLHEDDDNYGKYFKSYNKATDFTDEMDKWGNIKTDPAPYNTDVDRPWVKLKLDIYGKWSKRTIGADGIQVVYDAGAGTGAPTDSVLHKDNTDAVAGAASIPNDSNKVFNQWVVQRWNGSSYEPTDTKVYPGEAFTINVDDARIQNAAGEDVAQAVEGNNYTYTILLVAEYVDKEEATPTHIPWYMNEGDPAFHIDKIGEGETSSSLGINEKVAIQENKDPDRVGYTFLGWAKVEMGNTAAEVEAFENTDTNWTQTLTAANLFLYYNSSDGNFYTEDTFTNRVEYVAADEATPYQAMFAVWEKIPGYYIYHSGSKELEFHPFTDDPHPVDDLTKIVTSGYLYGGYYESDLQNKQKGKAITDSGMRFGEKEKKDGDVYYLKEVPDTYLKPQIYLIYNEKHNGLIQGLYGFVNVDSDEDYDECGLIIGGEPYKHEGDLASEGIVVTKPGEPDKILDSFTLFSMDSSDPCYTGMRKLNELISGGVTLQISGYYVTWDGIKVTGYKDRMLKFAANDVNYNAPVFTGWNNDGNTKCGLKAVDSTCTETTTSGGKRMMVTRMLMISAPSDNTEYRITKVYDSGTEEQIIEAGDYSGKIAYVPKDGYMFAGWYKDQAFKVPADFSNVTGDMTVYAKYLDIEEITVVFSLRAQKSNATILNAAISVNNRDSYKNVTVNVNDTISATLATKSVTKYGSGKNATYTTKYKGQVTVNKLSIGDTFIASISWTTPDGTFVTGANKECTYNSGSVTVR